jgi:hypothetical protein
MGKEIGNILEAESSDIQGRNKDVTPLWEGVCGCDQR